MVNPYWYDADDYSAEFAATEDPRVFAVIERDTDPHAPDGDALAPAYYVTRRWGDASVTHAGDVFHDAATESIVEDIYRAYAEFDARGIRDAWKTTERYARIFHDAVFTIIHHYNLEGELIILDTPTYRAHIGRMADSFPNKRMPWHGFNLAAPGGMGGVGFSADEYLGGDISEWTDYLDGDVYGVGYAVIPGRVIDNGEMPMWEDLAPHITIECWGFYGADYARESAFRFDYGHPVLDELLTLPVDDESDAR